MPIEWDAAKSTANRDKHGVSFEEAGELLASDADYLEIYDDQHSDNEERFIAIGRVGRGVMVVVFTERDDDVVRIISARMATKTERGRYEEVEKTGRRR